MDPDLAGTQSLLSPSIGVDGDHPFRIKHRVCSASEVYAYQLLRLAAQIESYRAMLGREMKDCGAVRLIQSLDGAVAIAVASSQDIPRLSLEGHQLGLQRAPRAAMTRNEKPRAWKDQRETCQTEVPAASAPNDRRDEPEEGNQTADR